MKKKIIVTLACMIFAVTAAALCACSDKVELPQYTVTFDSHGGSPVASVRVTVGDKVARPADPVREDSSFDAWYKQVDAGNGKTVMVKYDFDSRMNAEDLTLHALWNGNRQVRIVYNANGGTFADGVADYELGHVGAEFYEPDENPMYTGYIFGGWYTDAECTHAFVFDVYPDVDTVLYANWDEDPDYAYITFYGNDRILKVNPVRKGDPILAPQLFDEKLAETLVVSDWYSDAQLKTRYRFGRASNNMSLYMAYYTKGLIFDGAAVSNYDGDSEEVYVPNIYNGTTIDTIGEYAFNRPISDAFSKIRNIYLPDTIATVSKGAFYNCQYLVSVNLNSKVTAISDEAFYSNIRLRSVGDISAVTTIGEAAFIGCETLEDLSLPAGLTSIGAYAFSDCKRLAEAVVPVGVSVIPAYAFEGCSQLVSVKLMSGELTSIGEYAFGNCGALRSVVIEKTSGVVAFDAKNPFSNSPNVSIYVPSDLLDNYKSNTSDASVKDKLAAIR